MQGHFGWLLLLAIFLGEPLAAQSPIYIPPPVDPVEPVTMEPDLEPALPAAAARRHRQTRLP